MHTRLTYALLLTVILVLASSCGDTFTVRVIDTGGNAIAGARVGFATMEAIEAVTSADPSAEIPVGLMLTTNDYGAFTHEIPTDLPGIDRVVIWAAADGYRGAFPGGAPIDGWVPTFGELERAKAPVFNLNKQQTFEIKLESYVAVRENHLVAMRDGTKLSTDIYLPHGDGPWPVVLIRTPYNKDGNESYAAMCTQYGMALACQDMRGRFASEGENLPFMFCGWGEARDGYDTIEWLTGQPWCDGNVGTVGGSALGITQNLMAPTQPPGLKCQYINVATSSLYHQAAYQGGALRQSQVDGWLNGSEFDPEAIRLYKLHNNYDEFWEQFDISTRIEDIITPAVHLGGWFDTFLQGTIDSYVLRQHQGGEGARGNQWLIMGPWTHSGFGKTTQGEAVFPENARYSPSCEYGEWFGYWLLGQDTGIKDIPKVTYYLMGDLDDPDAPGNEWRYADDWPIPYMDAVFHLHPGGGLKYSTPGTSRPTPFVYDPADPTPTIGGRNLVLDDGMFDQRAIESRADIVLFDTDPLDEPLTITGRVRCKLFVSSDAINTDVAVRMCDVYPDGKSMLVADGMLRLSHRNSMEYAEPLVPGEIYEVEVDLWSTAIVFNQGHKVRLSISGSNFPRWDLNPGNGAIWEDGVDYVVQNNLIHHDAEHPSVLILPVPKAVTGPAE